MQNLRYFQPNPGYWPWAEKWLIEKFTELRKVGILVNNHYLKAKMLEFVPQTPGADPEKVKNSRRRTGGYKASKIAKESVRGFKQIRNPNHNSNDEGS